MAYNREFDEAVIKAGKALEAITKRELKKIGRVTSEYQAKRLEFVKTLPSDVAKALGFTLTIDGKVHSPVLMVPLHPLEDPNQYIELTAETPCWGCNQGIPLDENECHVLPNGDGGLCLNLDVPLPDESQTP